MPLGQAEETIEGVRIAGLVDQVNWAAVNAVTVDPTGRIEFHSLRTLEPSEYYYSLPVTLPLNLEVAAGVEIYNTCSVDLMMQCMIWFTDPDGEVRGYYEQPEPDLYLVGEHSPVGTRYALLDKPGNWTLRAELYAEVA